VIFDESLAPSSCQKSQKSPYSSTKFQIKHLFPNIESTTNIHIFPNIESTTKSLEKHYNHHLAKAKFKPHSSLRSNPLVRGV
jgi:hypothetical protein